MSGDPSGVALLVDTLHHALPADAEAVLAGLGDAVLAAGLEAAELPIAVVVADFVVARGGPESAAALTRRALADSTVSEPHNVLRALIGRADPAVDAALFFPRPEGAHLWARQAVLRDPGADNELPVVEPVLPDSPAEQPPAVEPTLRSRLAEQLRRIRVRTDAHPHSRTRVEDQYLGAAVGGGDRELLELALPAALKRGDPGQWGPGRLPQAHQSYQWSRPGVCAAGQTLPWDAVMARAAHVGDGACPGLEEAAAREDLTPAMREELEAEWSRAAFFVPRPDAPAIAHAQREAERSLAPAVRHFAVRELVVRGLSHHTLTAADVLATVTPAAEALALAAPVTPMLEQYHRKHRLARHPVPDATVERSVSDVRHAVADLLAESLGEAAVLWRTLLLQVGAWPGPFAELVALVAEGGELPAPSGRAPRWPRGVDAAAVLLTLAPPKAADGFLAEAASSPAVAGVVTRVLDRGPIPLALVEYALGPEGSPAMRRALARNRESGFGLLARLVEEFPAETEMLAVVYLALSRWTVDAGPSRLGAVDDLRARIVLHSEEHGGLHERLLRRFRHFRADLDELRPALASQNPATLHSVLTRVNGRIDPGHRIRAYASLAALTGPEPVWALELKRVGTLEKASSAVRASMAAGGIEPLLEAADLTGVPSYAEKPLGELWPGEPQVTAAGPDTAGLVRAELDGRPERWRAVAAAWTTGPAVPLDALVRGLP